MTCSDQLKKKPANAAKYVNNLRNIYDPGKITLNIDYLEKNSAGIKFYGQMNSTFVFPCNISKHIKMSFGNPWKALVLVFYEHAETQQLCYDKLETSTKYSINLHDPWINWPLSDPQLATDPLLKFQEQQKYKIQIEKVYFKNKFDRKSTCDCPITALRKAENAPWQRSVEILLDMMAISTALCYAWGFNLPVVINNYQIWIIYRENITKQQ